MRYLILFLSAFLLTANVVMAQITGPVPTSFEMLDAQGHGYLLPRDSILADISDSVAALHDSSALYSNRTQGLSESGGTSTFNNELIVIDTDTINVRDDMKAAEGLSFDLDYYFNRSVEPFICYTGAYTWAAYNSGVTAADVATYKTDGSSVKITIASSGAFQGASIDITDWDAELWQDGDASTTADYIIIALNIATQDITDLGTSKLELLLLCTNASPDTTDGYRYEFSTPSNGWNYYKVAKSAFTEIGTGDWGDITWVLVRNNLTATSAEVIFYVDVGQMVRKAIAGAYPNPFQQEYLTDIWKADWTMDGTYNNTWIVEESGVVSMMMAEATVGANYIQSAKPFGTNYRASGIVKAGTGGNSYALAGSDGHYLNAGAGSGVGVMDSSGAWHLDAGLTLAAGNIVEWSLERNNTSITGLMRRGVKWYGASTFYHRDVTDYIKIYLYEGERMYPFGVSTVSYADYARAAGSAFGLGIKVGNKDSLWIQKGDSTYHILATPYYNPTGL